MKSYQSSGTRLNRRRGSSLIEFTIVGVPVIFLFVSVVSCSIDMWQFFTLSYAVSETTRYASMHGETCGAGGNSCTITRAQLATYFTGQAIALNPASTTLTLNDGSGVITCNPITACPSSASQFPSAGFNAVGTSNVTVSAKYALINPIAMFWPGGGNTRAASFTVGATSTQGVQY